MTTANLLPHDHAHAIAEAARRYLADRLEEVRPRLERLSAAGGLYVGNVYRDYAVLMEIAEALNDGEITRAAQTAGRLDSIQRDEMPTAAWDFLANVRATANA